MQGNFTTYYREEWIHPQFKAAFAWLDDILAVDDKKLSHCDTCRQLIIAGGALRSHFTNTPVRDYDIYGNAEVIACIQKNMDKSYARWRLLAETERSWTYRCSVADIGRDKNDLIFPAFNIIKAPFDSPQAVIDSFDYTVCMCAINTEQITYHPDYFTDLATKKLRVNSLEEPLAALWRMQKYIKLGYSIDREEAWKLVEAIHDLPRLPEVVEKKEEIKTTEVLLEHVFRQS